jgi:hypothetical protein
VAKFSTQDDNNQLSPSKQAAVCGLRSAWEVISGHADMQGTRKKYSGSTINIIVAQPDLASTSALYILLDLNSNSEENLTVKLLLQCEMYFIF